MEKQTGLRKDIYNSIISVINRCTESKDKFSILHFNNNVYFGDENKTMILEIDATAQISYIYANDLGIWEWNKNVINNLKSNIPPWRISELSYYLRPKIEFKISQVNILHLLRGIAIKYLNGHKYVEYSQINKEINKITIICIYNSETTRNLLRRPMDSKVFIHE